MTKIKLTIEYLGTAYCGWQSQTNGVSVQDTVERALGGFFGCEYVRIYAAGRTDAGVHATGQVAHFVTDGQVNCHKLCLGVNTSLPPDISIVSAEQVSDDFDARRSAVSKTYVYRLYMSPTRRPMLDVDHAQVYKRLDIDAMRRAAALLTGTHDFTAFRKQGSNLVGTVRTVNSLEVESDGEEVTFTVNGNAFLYNQVRNMCGVLVEVGRGRFTLADVQTLLDGTRLHYKTLPARGLTLEQVFY